MFELGVLASVEFQLNFTLADLLSTALAIAVFPLFLFLPGFVFGWLLDLASFRQRTPLLRILLSLPLSLSLTPVIIYLLGRQFSTSAVWWFFAAVWLTFPVMLMRSNRARGQFPRGLLKPLTVIAVIWVAVALLSLVDLQFGHRLYFSAVSYDYTVRSAAVGQLARAHWYPPANPFFYPGHAEPFRYHYFWFMLCSWPVRLATHWIGPRPAIFAGVVWTGFTLMATVALYLRLFDRYGGIAIRRRTLLAFGLLAITGLDIIPTLFLDFFRLKFHFGNIFPTVDWWNPEQVTGWLDTALWVPHHLAGLLACMTGFLILWVEWQTPAKRVRWQAVLGAGVAFASAGGLSVYVAFAFAAFLAIWILFDLTYRHFRAHRARLRAATQERNSPVLRAGRLIPGPLCACFSKQLISLAGAGVLALLLGAPFMLDLASAGSGGTTGHDASFIRFSIRVFQPAHIALNLLHHNSPLISFVTDFLLLPLNFLIELGALFLIGVIKIRQWQAGQPFTLANRAAVMMVSASLFISIFLRSNTIDNNDLGMRGMLIVQFVLVLWGADVLLEWRSHKASTGREGCPLGPPRDERGTSADLGRAHSRFGASCAISRESESVVRASSSSASTGRDSAHSETVSLDRWIRVAQASLAAALFLGAITNVYELFILRTFTMLTEAGLQTGTNHINPGAHFAERAFYSRQLYEWLDRHTPQWAVEQHDPFAPFDVIPGLYADRQMGLAALGTAVSFGGNPVESSQMAESLRTIYSTGTARGDPDAICRQYKIDYLIVRNDSPVWNDRQSWVWQGKPVYSNPGTRAFACGGH